MNVNDLITKGDLIAFKGELLTELKQIITAEVPKQQQPWLKSGEVRELLKISPGTLQNLRVNGTIRFTRIGKIMYYKREDIQTLLEGGQL